MVLQVALSKDENLPETVGHTISNANVAEALLDLYFGENTVTPSMILSVAEAICA